MSGLIANVINAFDGLYYNVSTELNLAIITVVMLVIMKNMHPKKTAYYTYLVTGICAGVLVGVCDIILAFISQYPDNDMDAMFYIAMTFTSFMYYTCMCNMLMYIVFLLPDARKKLLRGEFIGRTISIVLTVLTGILYILVGIRRNYLGIVDLSLYMRTLVCVTAAAIAFMVVFLRKYKKKLSRQISVGILSFLPFYMIFAVMQWFQTKAMFLSILAALPLFCLYVFFHSNPFDEILGCQNTYSLEVKFNQNMKDKKQFYFGMIRIPSLVHDAVSTEDSDDVKVIIRILRTFEQKYKKLHMYRRTVGEFYLIFDEKYSEHSYEEAQDISKIIRKKMIQVNALEKYVFVMFEVNENIKSLNMMTDIVNKAVEKYSTQTGDCDRIFRENEYDELIDGYYLSELFEHLRDGNIYDNENVVCYAQPIYEVKSGQFKTAEALMRLYVDGELIPPDFFIPIAEANHCIHFLTICMLHKVCNAIVELMKTSEFDAISVNVSVQELSEANVAAEFLYIIDHYGVPKDKIRIELTESALANDNDNLKHNMSQLSNAGIKFYLDDFGTGYSSLERITELPFSVVKLDKSLLYSALNNAKTDRLVSGLVPLLKDDGFVALVEGVEDMNQHAYSVDIGFDYIQGFQWAKPLPIERLKEYFEKKKE